MQALKFDVHGMTCGGCTGSVQRVLGKLDGVHHAEVTLRPGVAIVQADLTRVTPVQIEAAIAGLGYDAKFRPSEGDEQAAP
jgi:copper chaperone